MGFCDGSRIPCSFYLSPEVVKKLDEVCDETGLKRSAVVEWAVLNVKVRVRTRAKIIREKTV